MLSRALAEIFRDPKLSQTVALRGGTAIHKLHFSPPRRFSNDIDLVQLRPGPFGPTMDRLHQQLDGWLGEPRRKQGQGVTLIYRYESEIPPVVSLKLKIETNTREHSNVLGTTKKRVTMTSRWWSGTVEVNTFHLEELMGTKLRALFQRKKGRDLFDLCVALDAGIDPAAIMNVFRAYIKAEGREITRAIFEKNLAEKVRLPAFTNDIQILLPPGTLFDTAAGADRVRKDLLALLPGDPWKGRGKSTQRKS